MACSKCDASCTCRLRVQDTNTIDLTLAGSGSRAAPWVISGVALIDNRAGGPHAQGSPQANASDAANFLQEVTGDDGGLTVYPSLDDGNIVGVGSDGGIYIPLVDSACIDLQGSGTEADPYTLVPRIADNAECGDGNFLTCVDTGDPNTSGLCVPLSADDGNIVVFGTDGGIYAPASPIEIGCGLTFDAAGAIAVNPSAADFSGVPDQYADGYLEGFADCVVEQGMVIACGGDGRIYAEPPHFSSVGFDGMGMSTIPPGTVIPPGSCVAGNVVQHTITNPSNCRPLAIHLQMGMNSGGYAMDAGAQLQAGYIRNIDPVATPGGGGGGQQPGPFVAPGVVLGAVPIIEIVRAPRASGAGELQTINNMERDFFNIQIPPGQTVTFEFQSVVCNSGVADMVVAAGGPGGSARHWGGTS